MVILRSDVSSVTDDTFTYSNVVLFERNWTWVALSDFIHRNKDYYLDFNRQNNVFSYIHRAKQFNFS